MDLLKLDSNYVAIDLVENYDSLIWTERFVDLGDFTLVSSDVQGMLNLLPLETPVKLVDSLCIMLVENQSIDKDEETGLFTITITGRSMECIYERRIWPNPSTLNVSTYPVEYLNAPDLVGKILEVFFEDHVGTTPEDFHPDIVSYATAGDYDETTVSYSIQPGPLSDNLSKIRVASNIGVLPMTTISCFGGPDGGDGRTPGSSKVVMLMYPGNDRSVPFDSTGFGTIILPPITFTTAKGEFEDQQYLFSNKDFKNTCFVYANGARVAALAATGYSGVLGLNRRVLYVDASDIDTTGLTTAQKAAVYTTRGRFELAQHNQTAYMSGKIVGQTTAKFGYYLKQGQAYLQPGYFGDYWLGDIVNVVGNFGFVEKMRVSEYIRTEDGNGETAYPTLIVDS